DEAAAAPGRRAQTVPPYHVESAHASGGGARPARDRGRDGPAMVTTLERAVEQVSTAVAQARQEPIGKVLRWIGQQLPKAQRAFTAVERACGQDFDRWHVTLMQGDLELIAPIQGALTQARRVLQDTQTLRREFPGDIDFIEDIVRTLTVTPGAPMTL